MKNPQLDFCINVVRWSKQDLKLAIFNLEEDSAWSSKWPARGSNTVNKKIKKHSNMQKLSKWQKRNTKNHWTKTLH